MRTRVLVADDHRAALSVLRSILDSLPDFEVIATARSGPEVVRLAAKLEPAVVLLDVSMAGLSGLAATREILRKNQAIRVIAVSMHRESSFVGRLRSAGALGYLLKEDAYAELPDALRAVVAGHEYISSRISGPWSRALKQ